MSKTFPMSSDQAESLVPLPNTGLQLGQSLESHCSNSSMSSSTDSNSSVPILSDRGASSSPDVSMLECCLSEGFPVNKTCNITAPQGDVPCSVSMNLNQTFITTPLNATVNFWIENLRLMRSQETGSEKYQSCSMSTEGGSNSPEMFPDFAGRESQLSSYEVSQRGCTRNSCHSLSSGEMVMRNSSLEGQSVLVVSSLEDLSLSTAVGHPALPAASNLSATLSNVCEQSAERVAEENIGHPCLGMTFILADSHELTTEENDMAPSNSLLTLPNESGRGLLMSFGCETSSENWKNEALLASAEAELLPHFPGTNTPEQVKTFVSTMSAMQETDKGIHTSTPVQTTRNKVLSLPSFSESPCSENTSSLGLHPVKQQPISVTPKEHLAAGPLSTKVKKIEVKNLSKSDLSSVKSKGVTGAVSQMAVPGSASHHKSSQIHVNNKHSEAYRGKAIRTSPAKVWSSSTLVSAITKMFSGAKRLVNTDAANMGVAVMESCGHTVVEGQDSNKAFPHDCNPAPQKHTSAVQCSNSNPETEEPASSQVVDASAQHPANQTFCISPRKKSPDGRGQTDPKLTPQKGMSNKTEVRSGSTLSQHKPSVLNTRPRCSSESLSSRPPKDKRTALGFSATFTVPKAVTCLGQTKPSNLSCSSQNKRAVQSEASNTPTGNSTRVIKKISLLAERSKSTTEGTTWDESKSRIHGRPSPRPTRRAFSQLPPPSPRPPTVSTKQKLGALGRGECRISGVVWTPQSKQRSTAGSQRVQASGEPSLGNASRASIKPQLNGFQTPSRPTPIGLPSTPASRLPVKNPGPSRSLTGQSELGECAGSTQGGAAHKSTPFRSIIARTKLISTPGKNTQPILTTTCKSAALTSKQTSDLNHSPLKRTSSAKLVHITSSGPVDKNKPKARSRQQHPQQQAATRPNQSTGPPDVIPTSLSEVERKDCNIQKLRGVLAASNCRFEALTIVLQRALAERDEETRQCRELSQELVNLQGELVCSVNFSERLEKEKEELRVSLEDVLQKLQVQHQKDLAELEQRLQAFYQDEWHKINLNYQQEADKCKTFMQQQVSELKANHEAMKLELQNSHEEELQCVKQQYEASLEELRQVHNQELQCLDKTLKDAEAALSAQIQELSLENSALIEKLKAEENKRKELVEKSQKDSHTLYLEQELDSLKVVLDIKNKQLHQQDKKLMEVDKLTEKNVKLDDSLKKVQQENEDLKARMERHAALSRQLSTEQAMLQESLQKESKVNKRLSMENEELLWKLHNGDLSSPRKLSVTSQLRHVLQLSCLT
uniref:Microtubule associated tumor suppressor 1b n=1 Tax=Monopterus albus TaxID=43700 RepID=A0A3Q3JEY4_MONAL